MPQVPKCKWKHTVPTKPCKTVTQNIQSFLRACLASPRTPLTLSSKPQAHNSNRIPVCYKSWYRYQNSLSHDSIWKPIGYTNDPNLRNSCSTPGHSVTLKPRDQSASQKLITTSYTNRQDPRGCRGCQNTSGYSILEQRIHRSTLIQVIQTRRPKQKQKLSGRYIQQ